MPQPAGAQPAAVWILLTRHTTRKDQGREDFLTVHLFKKRGGFRVYYLEDCWQMGVYSSKALIAAVYGACDELNMPHVQWAASSALQWQNSNWLEMQVVLQHGVPPVARAGFECKILHFTFYSVKCKILHLF